MPDNCQIICIGRILLDIVGKTIDTLPPEEQACEIGEAILCTGGSAANTASALRSLGTSVGVAGSVGDDIIGDRLINNFERSGIFTYLSRDKQNPTSFCFVPLNKRGVARYLFNRGADCKMDLSLLIKNTRLRETVRGPWLKHIHIGGLNILNESSLIPLLKFIKDNNPSVTISVDTAKVPEISPETEYICSLSDIWFTTLLEAYYMTRQVTIESINQAIIDKGTKLVVLKMGNKGSCIYSKKFKQIIIIQTYQVDKQIYNLNGAGDIYAAVFLKEFLDSKHWPSIKDVSISQLQTWGNKATAFTVEYLVRDHLEPIQDLRSFTISDSVIQKTKSTHDTCILPIEHCFETSQYHRSAMQEATIPADCQNRVARYISKAIPNSGIIVDLCCGGAWLPIRIANMKSMHYNLHLDDKCQNQINIAKENIENFFNGKKQLVHFYCKDATYGTEIEPGIGTLVIISFSTHLFNEYQREQLAIEAFRVCSQNGHLVILTFSPRDMKKTLCSKYFEGYFDIDSKRYSKLDGIISTFTNSGFVHLHQRKFQFTTKYPNVYAFVEFIKTKPFSTFYLLEEKFGKQELEDRISRCQKKVINDFGTKEVSFKTKISLLMFRKVV